VVGLRTWKISEEMLTVETPQEAVEKAIALVEKSS
jgi:hypothetical protein